MRYLLSASLTLLFFIPVIAQNKPANVFPAQDLSIRWVTVQNDYQSRSRSLNALVITNNNKKLTFPASGWKMYFNSARIVVPEAVTGNVRLNFINGDLFNLVPQPGFEAIKPGASIRVEYIADDPVVNITDGPNGFYVVWDAQPDKGFATGELSTEPFSPTYKGLVTPEIIFAQNKLIREIDDSQLIKIFPSPVQYQENAGQFSLTANLQITADQRFTVEKQVLLTTLQTLLGKGITEATGGNAINLEYKAGLPAEGYEMEVGEHLITLRASGPAGIFYAIQSLKTLVPPASWSKAQASIAIPNVTVKDEPRFGYRAFMLDVGRNFQSKPEVLRLLDLMALFKLNVFRFHLTEDEGWRLEIPSLPELTSVGSQRGHSLDSKNFLPASYGSGPETGKPTGSGFYSKADFIEILRYAQARHIEVLPEIETPGHARAAIKAMHARYERLLREGKKEEAGRYLLYDSNDVSKYSTAQNWTDNIINPALPSTYNFVETVINDIVAMYKEAGVQLKSIHFGGDEVPEHVWEKSPAYEELKASHPEIKSTGDLWYYFYGKINDMVKARGLYLSGWEEMGLRKTQLDGRTIYLPNPDFAADHFQTDVWNNTLGGGNEDLAYKLANGGYKVVLACVTHLYFDMAHYKSFEEPGYYWGAFTDIDKPFSFIPYDYFKNSAVDRQGLPLDRSIFVGKQRLTDYGKTNIVGLQCAIWGENIRTNERLEYMLLPNMIGFAERAWAKDPEWATTADSTRSAQLYAEAWSAFLNGAAKRTLPLLDHYQGGYAYRIPKPGVQLIDGKYTVNNQFPGIAIRYTTDGKIPGVQSALYQGPVADPGKGLQFRAFDGRGRGSAVVSVGK